MSQSISEPTTGEYDAINFDGLERRANYRTIAYREDILHILEHKDAAAIIYQIISRWQTEIKRPQILKEIERRKQTKQPPLTAQEVENMMWVYMSYNDFVRESGGAVAYNTVIRMMHYLVNTKKVVEQRENHDPRYPDYEYRINKTAVKELLKALPTEPAFSPKVPKKKEKSTQEGIGLGDSTQEGTPPDESTQMGTESTQEGIATTQMGTEVYPNGGTSHITHNYTHNYNTEEERESPPNTLDSTAIVSSDTAHAFSSSGEIDEAMIREIIAQSSLSSEGEITEEFIQRTIDAFKQRVLVELRARPGLSEHPDDQLPSKQDEQVFTNEPQGDTHANRVPTVPRANHPAPGERDASRHPQSDNHRAARASDDLPVVYPVGSGTPGQEDCAGRAQDGSVDKKDPAETLTETPTTTTPAQSLSSPQAEQAALGSAHGTRGTAPQAQPQTAESAKWNVQAMVARACELRGKPFSDTARPKETKAAQKLFARKPDLTEEEFEKAWKHWNTQWWRDTNGLFNLTDLAAVPKDKSEMRLIIALEKLVLPKARIVDQGTRAPVITMPNQPITNIRELVRQREALRAAAVVGV